MRRNLVESTVHGVSSWDSVARDREVSPDDCELDLSKSCICNGMILLISLTKSWQKLRKRKLVISFLSSETLKFLSRLGETKA